MGWLLVLMVLSAQQVRLQEHFTTVDAELRAADVRGLTEAQRERRAALIEELGRYRERGVFPRNLDFAVRTPYFIDDRGVRCAMAHLIETHGGAALVARVAATANNAYVGELAADAELVAWLARNGLTAAEAARIQPSYEREAGERCYGQLYPCKQGVACVAVDDDPDNAFCSPACDPNADACPVGLAGVQMVCGDQNVCVYPGIPPGSTGWACDTSTAEVCAWACVGIEEPGDVGVCAPSCSKSRPCPTDYECEPLQGTTDELRTCMPKVEDTGCSAGGSSSGFLAFVLFALCARRRRSDTTAHGRGRWTFHAASTAQSRRRSRR